MDSGMYIAFVHYIHEQNCIMHVLVLSIPAASTDDIYKFRFISVCVYIHPLVSVPEKPAPHTTDTKEYHAKKQVTSKN
jgi:hypothetical protein